MMDLIAVGFQEILNPTCLLLIFGGTMLGIIFGAIPGLSATMAIALCLPMTYGMDHINGMALLIGLYIGGISGGLVSTMLHIPWSAASSELPPAWTRALLPRPASLEKIPRATPFCIATIIEPTTPPVTALGLNAAVTTVTIAFGISVMLQMIRATLKMI